MDPADLELFAPPPELMAGPREGQRETVQAKALLEKTERLLQTVPEQDRAEVERLMTAVRNNLTDRRWDELPASCGALSDVLFYLEDA
jgi:molecular chaperone DnaK